MQVTEDEPPTPGVKPPERKQNIVSGGLTGFNVAEDLLNMDFKDPEEVPEEFKAMAYNASSTKEIRKGVSGESSPDWITALPDQGARVLKSQ